jgi:hypothetical protein
MAEAATSFALGRQFPLAEAHGLYRMIQLECSVDELRELIAVPPNIERVLRAYANAHAEDAHWIEACLELRKAVAEEFEPYSAPAPRGSTGVHRAVGSECFPAL